MLAIEIIEGCNFKCYFCSAKDLEKFSFMKIDLFKKIVLEAKEIGITKLNLVPCMGEPFLHPNIYEILEFANSHMQEVMIFTNATAINIDKLKNIKMNNIKLNISYYGNTLEKFIEITNTSNSLFKIFHKKLEDLEKAKIKFEVHRRDSKDQIFDYDEGPDVSKGSINPNDKCKYHQEPKVFVNGDVTFCIFAREAFPDSKNIFYDNLNRVSLREALENPIRYKFYDSQSICASCSSHDRNCYTGVTIKSIKLIASSKKNYLENKEQVDSQYLRIEHEII